MTSLGIRIALSFILAAWSCIVLLIICVNIQSDYSFCSTITPFSCLIVINLWWDFVLVPTLLWKINISYQYWVHIHLAHGVYNHLGSTASTGCDQNFDLSLGIGNVPAQLKKIYSYKPRVMTLIFWEIHSFLFGWLFSMGIIGDACSILENGN